MIDEILKLKIMLSKEAILDSVVKDWTTPISRKDCYDAMDEYAEHKLIKDSSLYETQVCLQTMINRVRQAVNKNELVLNAQFQKAFDNALYIIKKYSKTDDSLRLVQSQVNNTIDNGWISVEDKPLITKDEKGNWFCTKEGDGEFLAAVPYLDKKRPNENNLWWIRHCVIQDGFGLCVVGDDDNEAAGWEIESITHWQPLPKAPNQK